jgi:hypothetical protein
MPGTNAGTGQLVHFRCSQCRKRRWKWPNGAVQRVKVTGRTRLVPRGRKGRRTSYWRFEYKCQDCLHIGWSRHIDVERRYVSSGYELPEKK